MNDRCENSCAFRLVGIATYFVQDQRGLKKSIACFQSLNRSAFDLEFKRPFDDVPTYRPRMPMRWTSGQRIESHFNHRRGRFFFIKFGFVLVLPQHVDMHLSLFGRRFCLAVLGRGQACCERYHRRSCNHQSN